jgi:hypothetical protein
LLRPQLDDREAFSVNFTPEPRNSIHYGDGVISPGETRHTTIQFYTGSPGQDEGKPLKVEFVMIDQYAHEHCVTLALRYF